jgi:16S rRNA (guanine966-N2)-methyltransferase
MRIIAGALKGRPLQGPGTAKGVRPTADRVRETLFNVLGQWLDGLTVLDLFAGTGALALEAVSRGAAQAVLVDRDVTWARKNVAALGLSARVRLYQAPVDRALEQLARGGETFDLVFCDPPYADEAAAWVLAGVKPLLKAGARVVLEHGKREKVPEEGLVDQRRFGDTVVSIYG